MFVKVGCRSDKLSLAQADLVISRLRQSQPTLQVERKSLNIKVDEGSQSKLPLPGQRRVWEKELGRAVWDGKVDIAVLSLKDVPPPERTLGLVVAAMLERGSPYDVIIGRDGRDLKSLRPDSRVGTSSLLRYGQLKRVRADLRAEPVGGDVLGRLSKLDKGVFDALILAESSLARVGMSGRITQRLSMDEFMPAPGQGIIAAVAKQGNRKILEAVKVIDHPATRASGSAEQEVAHQIIRECTVPIGAYASRSGDSLRLLASVVSADGRESLKASNVGPVYDSITLARGVAESLLVQGTRRLEEGWRKLYPLEDD